MSRRTLFTLIVPLLLVAAYFGITARVRAHVDELIQAAIGHPLPTFSLADRSGRLWTNGDLAGKRTVLHFFRSQCEGCEREAPAIRELESHLPADVVLLHVMTDQVLAFPADVTAATLARKNFTQPVLMADAPFVNAFHQLKWSQVTPITYIIDSHGTTRFGLRGAQTAASINQALDAAR